MQDHPARTSEEDGVCWRPAGHTGRHRSRYAWRVTKLWMAAYNERNREARNAARREARRKGAAFFRVWYSRTMT